MKMSKAIASLITLFAVNQAQASSDLIYNNIGTINPDTYTFVAQKTGTINAYFAGSGAAYNEILGLEINGVNTGNWGLENKNSAIGQEMSWNVQAGQVLTFVDFIWGWNPVQFNQQGQPTDGMYTVSSNASQNLDGNNHVYANNFVSANATYVYNIQQINGTYNGVSLGNIPVDGTFVAFEDEQSLRGYPTSDYNYNDLDFVFTNVGVTPHGGGTPFGPGANVPEPASIALLSLGLLVMSRYAKKSTQKF